MNTKQIKHPAALVRHSLGDAGSHRALWRRPADGAAAAGAGKRLKTLRQRCGLSIRQLATQAGVTAGMISCIERDRNSPSIATLQKILAALSTDLASFFGNDSSLETGPVYERQRMKLVSDIERSYTIVFPRRKEIAVEMFDEQFLPMKRRPPYETLECDVAGYVIEGSLRLELPGVRARLLRPGDAFYVTRGRRHRGYAIGKEPARVITAYSPAGY